MDYLMSLNEVKSHAGTLITSIIQHYFAQCQSCVPTGDIPVHDSSAIMYLFHPEVYKTTPFHLRVECTGTFTCGMMVAYDPSSKPGLEVCNVALEVNANKFKSIYKEAVCALQQYLN
tara:strand:- start:1006 stop:1356 length:351 start_codon:yes stop_codon:yes gene_type:complete